MKLWHGVGIAAGILGVLVVVNLVRKPENDSAAKASKASKEDSRECLAHAYAETCKRDASAYKMPDEVMTLCRHRARDLRPDEHKKLANVTLSHPEMRDCKWHYKSAIGSEAFECIYDPSTGNADVRF